MFCVSTCDAFPTTPLPKQIAYFSPGSGWENDAKGRVYKEVETN